MNENRQKKRKKKETNDKFWKLGEKKNNDKSKRLMRLMDSENYKKKKLNEKHESIVLVRSRLGCNKKKMMYINLKSILNEYYLD